MTLNELVGARVRYYRTKIGISAAKFGARMEAELGEPWSRQTVWEAETGRRSFRLEELIALARVVQVPIAFFVQVQAPQRITEVERPGSAPPITIGDLKDLFRPVGAAPARYRLTDQMIEEARTVQQGAKRIEEGLKMFSDKVYDTRTGEPTGRIAEQES